MPSALLTLYRSLTRHKLYAFLSIGGLALGTLITLVLIPALYSLLFDRLPALRARQAPALETP